MISTNSAAAYDYFPTILFVDDEQAVLNSLNRFSHGKPWTAHCVTSGEAGLSFLETERADIVVSDMRMPRMSGTEFLTTVRERYPDTTLILLTGYSDLEALEGAINQAKIFNYITKPWDEVDFSDVLDKACQDQLMRHKDKIQQETVQKKSRKLGKIALLLDKKSKEKGMETEQALALLESVNLQADVNLNELLNVLLELISWQEDNSESYYQFVSEYSLNLAKKFDISGVELVDLEIASKLHNVGLLSFPEEIRRKSYHNLSKEERNKFHQHCLKSESMLKAVPKLAAVAKIVRSHREYVNGTGYPDKIIHKAIPLPARIMCVVCDYIDLFNGRLIRGVSGNEGAKRFLEQNSGKRYDADIVAAFIDLLADAPKYLVGRQSKSTSTLKPGMIIAEDVKTPQGIVLLAKGAKVNEKSIKKLFKYEDDFNIEFEIHIQEEKESRDLKGTRI